MPRLVKAHRACHADQRTSRCARPAYEKISRRFYENPAQLGDAFARAWFKLTTGQGLAPAISARRCLAEELICQDPIPAVQSQVD